MSDRSFYIIGAGGHVRSVIPLLQHGGFNVKGIYDDSWKNDEKESILGIPVIGTTSDISVGSMLFLAVGDNKSRADYFLKFKELVFPDVVRHPSAIIEQSVHFGVSNLVFAKVFINSEVSIGDNNIINSGCIIEHESVIGSNCHISIGSVISGRVKIGDHCFIGAGAVIRDKINICTGVTVGAGSVVIHNITEPGVYAGCPAKKIK